MNIQVEYKDTAGTISQRQYSLTRLAFAKHLAMAGQGYSFSPRNLLRAVGMFFHYSYYLRGDDFRNNRFSRPPNALSDPTEQGQFSNLAGKAIADFLSKQIDKSLFTINYEAAMRAKNLRIKGKRPDLIAYSGNPCLPLNRKDGFNEIREI